MPLPLFRAEDWVYVADSMGRLGQGYYKNRKNSSQTITSNEFEKRRTQPVAISSKQEKEQTINKTSPLSSNPSLSSTTSEATTLTPWDNPTIGEQAATPIKNTTQPIEKRRTPTSPLPAPIAANQPKPQPVQQNITNNDVNGGNEGGDNESAKVICTELVRQGHMRESERRACTIYALSRLPNRFLIGYHFWAVPYVRLMRKSRLASQIITPLVTSRTQEVCYRLGLRKKGSFLGRILCALHDPLCSLIGHFVQKTDYSSLYKQEISS